MTMLGGRWVVAALPVALLLAGCGDDEDPVAPEEPEIAVIRIAAGTQLLTISENGTVQGGPLEVPDDGSVTVVGTFFDSDNQEVSLSTDEFVLNFEPAAPGLLGFERTSAFRGILRGLGPASTTLRIGLFHEGEEHYEFGPFPIPVTVTGTVLNN